MTPKEKAEELVHKFKPFVQFEMGFDQSYKLKMAKQCALISVDEIVKNGIYSFEDNRYWEEVKKEIEKL